MRNSIDVFVECLRAQLNDWRRGDPVSLHDNAALTAEALNAVLTLVVRGDATREPVEAKLNEVMNRFR
jgi:hypothetical protein